MLSQLLVLLLVVQNPPEGEKAPQPPSKEEAPKQEVPKLPAARPVPVKGPSQKEIDKAIDGGAQYLLKVQGKDGSWLMVPENLRDHAYDKFMGAQVLSHTAFCLLTLLHADVDPKHKQIKKGFEFLKKRSKDFRHTYNCAVTLMAIDAYAEKLLKQKQAGGKKASKGKDKAWMFRQLGTLRNLARDLTIRLVLGQREDGSWTYGAWSGSTAVGGGGGTGIRSPGGPGGAAKTKGDRPPVPPGWGRFGGDLSNTQYALLGLRSASEIGLVIDTQVWLRAIHCLLDRQEKDGPVVPSFPIPGATPKLWELKEMKDPQGGRKKIGKPKARKPGPTTVREGRTEFKARGWGYADGVNIEGKPVRPHPYGSMTLVGVVSLVISKYYLNNHMQMRGDLGKRVDEAIQDGCAWTMLNFSVKDNMKYDAPEASWKYRNDPPHIDGYYMYSLERVGILAGIRHFGRDNWYKLGARLLVDQQGGDGAWKSQMSYEPLPTISTCFAVLFLKRATQPFLIIESKRLEKGPGLPKAGE